MVSGVKTTQDNRANTYNLRHVQNDDSGLETDTDTGNETTDNDGSKWITSTSDHLDDNTDGVDQAADDNSPLATNKVGDVAGNDSTKEGTAGQDRHDQRSVGLGDGLGAGEFDCVDEDAGTENAVDVTRVITEEDTSEGGERADQVGLPGDWGFDALDILRRGQAVDVGCRRTARLFLVCCVRHVGVCRALDRADSG